MSVLVCLFAGSLVVAAVHYFGRPTRAEPVVFLTISAVGFLALIAGLVILNRPWEFETFQRRSIQFLVCLLVGFGFGAWAGQLAGGGREEISVTTVVVAAFSFQGAALVFIHRFLRAHEIGWRAAFGLASPGITRALVWGVGAGVAVLPVAWLLGVASAQVMQSISVPVVVQQPVQALQSAVSVGEKLALGFFAVVLAPPVEELLFRGILYPALKQHGYPRIALWGTALLFGAMHANAMAFLPMVFLGLVLARLYDATGNLLAPMVAHLLFNGVNFGWMLLVHPQLR
jgi:hypothetical protein